MVDTGSTLTAEYEWANPKSPDPSWRGERGLGFTRG